MRIVPAAGWQRVRIDRARGTVRIPAGVEIDLGATAKALAADRCARAVHARDRRGRARQPRRRHRARRPGPGGGWPIRVTDDHRSDATRRRPDDRAGGRRPRDLEHDRAPLARRRRRACTTSSIRAAARPPTRSGARSACGRRLRRGQHGQHRRDRARRGRRRLARARGLPARLVRRDGTTAHTCGWPAEAAA